MSEEYGSDFITVTDDDGNSFELEHLDTLELDGETYMAVLPADMDEDNEDYGIVLLKTVEEDGEEMFVTIDDPEELERVHNKFMEVWFDDGEGNQLLASTTDIKGRTVFRLLTIDAKEYAYLKAINDFNTYGYDSSFIIEPTSLPTNVAGGIGFINIAAASVMSVEFERLGLKSRSSETIYY